MLDELYKEGSQYLLSGTAPWHVYLTLPEIAWHHCTWRDLPRNFSFAFNTGSNQGVEHWRPEMRRSATSSAWVAGRWGLLVIETKYVAWTGISSLAIYFSFQTLLRLQFKTCTLGSQVHYTWYSHLLCVILASSPGFSPGRGGGGWGYVHYGIGLCTCTLWLPHAHTYLSFACRLQAILATHGIPTQTQRQVEPIKIRAPQDILMKVERLQ